MDGESCFLRVMRNTIKPARVPMTSGLLYSFSCAEKLDNEKSCWRRAIVALAALLVGPFFLCSHALVFAQSHSPAIAIYQPQAFTDETLRYRMVSGQTVIGEMTVNIVRDDTHGLIHILESVSGLFERSTAFTLRHDATLRPLSSHTVFGKDNQLHAVHLKYDEATVTGQIDRAAEYGGTREVDSALAPATQDFFAVPYLLRARPLQLNEAITFAIFDFRQTRSAPARAWVAKKESIAVPAGDFVCYRVEGFSGKLRWIFLIDEKFPHHLVKQIFPAMEIEMALVTMQETDVISNDALKSSSLKLQ